MRIYQVVLLPQYEEKLLVKHQITNIEVEDIVLNHPHIRFLERGTHPGEDLYAAYGQTENGRYLVIFFIVKPDRSAMVISGRDMDRSERKYYGKQR